MGYLIRVNENKWAHGDSATFLGMKMDADMNKNNFFKII